VWLRADLRNIELGGGLGEASHPRDHQEGENIIDVLARGIHESIS
jgi:hypothetical protein